MSDTPMYGKKLAPVIRGQIEFIQDLEQRGFTRDEIAGELSKKGIDVKPGTLTTYLSRVNKKNDYTKKEKTIGKVGASAKPFSSKSASRQDMASSYLTENSTQARLVGSLTKEGDK